MALNILSTGAMLRLGKVRGNMMIDVHPTNDKLRDRAARIVSELTGVDHGSAIKQLEKSDWNVRRLVDEATGRSL